MWAIRRASTNYLKAPSLSIAAFRACAGLEPVSSHKGDKSSSSECHVFTVFGSIKSKTCTCIAPFSKNFSVRCRSLSSQAGAKSGEDENNWSSNIRRGDSTCDTTSDLFTRHENLGYTSETDVGIDDKEENGCNTSPPRAYVPSGLLKLILAEIGPISVALDKYIKGKELNRSEVYEVFLYLRLRKLYRKALELSEWLKGREDFDFIERDHASMLDLIAKVRGIHDAESYMNDIPKCFREEAVHRTLLANYVARALVNKAEQLFKKMKDLGFSFTTFTWDQMLLLYKKNDKRKVAQVFWIMENENIKPSLFSYQILIDTKGRLKDIKGMELVVEKMKAGGLKPTIRMQAILSQHYITWGFTKKAEVVLKEMEGSDLKSRGFIQSLLLPMYANLGKAEEVERIWKDVGSKPQQAQFLAGIAVFGMLKNVKQAETIFGEMRKTYNNNLTSNHYTSMLKVYAESKLLSEGKELLKQMREDGCYIGPVAWDALVKLYVDAGEAEKADSMLQEAIHCDPNVKLMYTSYLPILHVYSSRGDVDNAEKIFQRMKQAGYASRVRPFQALLETYINAKVPAFGIRKRMKENNIYPNQRLIALLDVVESF